MLAMVKVAGTSAALRAVDAVCPGLGLTVEACLSVKAIYDLGRRGGKPSYEDIIEALMEV